jgi:hypothetical protein
LCNGKTLAFQAKDAGSIPAARSSPAEDPVELSAHAGRIFWSFGIKGVLAGIHHLARLSAPRCEGGMITGDKNAAR